MLSLIAGDAWRPQEAGDSYSWLVASNQLCGLLCLWGREDDENPQTTPWPSLTSNVSGVSPDSEGSEGGGRLSGPVWTLTLLPCGPDSSSHGILQRWFPPGEPLSFFAYFAPIHLPNSAWMNEWVRNWEEWPRVSEGRHTKSYTWEAVVLQRKLHSGVVTLIGPDTIVSPGQPSLSSSRGGF